MKCVMLGWHIAQNPLSPLHFSSFTYLIVSRQNIIRAVETKFLQSEQQLTFVTEGTSLIPSYCVRDGSRIVVRPQISQQCCEDSTIWQPSVAVHLVGGE